MKIRGRCLPFRHDWKITRVSAPLWDPWARGILKRCRKCPAIRAK